MCPTQTATEWWNCNSYPGLGVWCSHLAWLHAPNCCAVLLSHVPCSASSYFSSYSVFWDLEALSVRLDGIFVEVSFLINHVPRLKAMMFDIFISQECTVEKTVLPIYFLEGSELIPYNKSSYHHRLLDLISLVLPVMISKGESLGLPWEMDLRFNSSKGRAFGSGGWKYSVSFANWVFITPLICSTGLDDWGW